MSDYYHVVEAYYDDDAPDFDARYWKNPVLQRIRQDFREEVKRYPASDVLEIGYGTGLDLVHFAETHPSVTFTGIDISGQMQAVASQKIQKAGLKNASASKGSVEDLTSLYPNRRFDMVYVFFGALNTVEDLKTAAVCINDVTAPGGKLVLTFVNKNYVAGMLLELMKFRFRASFSRFRKEWGGYSPSEYLPSRCYTPKQIRKAFYPFVPLKQKGYSILHPAWYYHRLNNMLHKILPALWKTDAMLNKSPFWSWGEYTLFVFEKPQKVGK